MGIIQVALKTLCLKQYRASQCVHKMKRLDFTVARRTEGKICSMKAAPRQKKVLRRSESGKTTAACVSLQHADGGLRKKWLSLRRLWKFLQKKWGKHQSFCRKHVSQLPVPPAPKSALEDLAIKGLLFNQNSLFIDNIYMPNTLSVSAF